MDLFLLDLLLYFLQGARFRLFVGFPVIFAVLAIYPLHFGEKWFELLVFLWGDIPVALLSELHEVLKLFAGLAIDGRQAHYAPLHVCNFIGQRRVKIFEIGSFVHPLSSTDYAINKEIILQAYDLLKKHLCIIIIIFRTKMLEVGIGFFWEDQLDLLLTVLHHVLDLLNERGVTSLLFSFRNCEDWARIWERMAGGFGR